MMQDDDEQPSTSGVQNPLSTARRRIDSISSDDEQPLIQNPQATAWNWKRIGSPSDEEYVKRGLNVSEIVSMWNLSRIIRTLGTQEECIAFAVEMELFIEDKVCRTHRTPMRVVYSSNKYFGSWVCNKQPCKNKIKISRAVGTFFENVRISMQHIFYLCYAYSARWSVDVTIREDPYKDENTQCLSRVTITDYFSYFRETVVIYYLEHQETKPKIGGPGKIVKIDEYKFGTKRYNCVLGLIEDGSEDLRLEVCPDNVQSADVLVPLIQKHVVEGTTIHSDYWRAYDLLGDHGYIINKKVIPSDPDNPPPDGTHNQRIESQWRAVKRFYRKYNYNNSQNFADLIVEYLWRRQLYKFKKDPFMELIKCIKYVYKPE